ncbi:Splicing factor 3A subunit 3 [Portunus trituberculatus]|uniref:Splicing factor 3A subunit 3 n=1 Tax=Portunus trituberculatus TaxID=210409 RepID=A0A5B7JIE8_PORTR|nr:Splicing factor 3A subunit 3 [Portunus trituberculatus]
MVRGHIGAMWSLLGTSLEKIDYITYLTTFDRLFEIPKEKKTTQYREYLYVLLDYLYAYVERVKPLLDLNQELEAVSKDFNEQWEAGR